MFTTPQCRLQQELTVFDMYFQLAQFRGRLYQRQRREHRLLAAASGFRHIQPVASTLVALTLHCTFAEVNHIGAAVNRLLVKSSSVSFGQ